MYRRWHHKIQLYYALLDIAIVSAAFALAYSTRAWINENPAFPSIEMYFEIPPQTRFILQLFTLAFWIGTGLSLRIYENVQLARWRRLFWDAARQTAITIAALILYQYFLHLDLSRLFIGLLALYAGGLAVTARPLGALGMIWWLGRFGTLRQVLIAGTGIHARRMAEALQKTPGIRLDGFVAVQDPAPREIEVGAQNLPVYPLPELANLLRRDVIDEIIFAVESRDLSELEDVFLLCDEEGVRSRLALDFFPHVNSRVYLDHLNQKPLLTFAAAPDDELLLLAKRGVDIAVSAAMLVALAPLMLLIAIGIKATSSGPVLFRQVRCGLNGRRFTMLKFRSMTTDAEQRKAEFEHLNVKSTAFKIPGDPRCTPIGAFLRRYSIDEWPQLWNVLRGDMSLVGPRPAVPQEVEQYEQWQRRRLRMRPGLTCLWTLAGRDALDFPTWMRLDLQYIDNWSFSQDLRILLHTIPVVFSGRDAY